MLFVTGLVTLTLFTSEPHLFWFFLFPYFISLIKKKIEKSSDNSWEKLIKKIFGQGMNDYAVIKIHSLHPLSIWSKG